ncbi:pyruvate flavodoxin/ferredoxin oxidoreductase [Desulfopila inferna]|uniref:pyruvate flavodoxin/ferredoxin oxidoreductase n=1 Tax=Desulfopila inferna TaxID=468528 RepID=UPI00196291DA|nr:pyruvate flavodoxin/ferredoxin oxidoreductase [Desulfopila inferna]MBM9603414.1 pyruvate flavodoxin/ferredoxin oxidoreductase [Desulfopila inferna]
MALTLIEGNEAVAHAALHSGCTFFAGYPITPATSILAKMLELLPPRGGVCLQGEDEIGSIGFCLGASMAGRKTMTATSGPGISLYSEQISFAVGSEIPLVIVNVQRLGPSTGSATKGADGDIHFMRWGNSGGLPVIVLAPVDVADCYTLTIQAFNLAEKYRCPVFLASNKEIGLTRESIDLDRLEVPELIERKMFSGDAENYLPFQVEQGDGVPDFLPIGESTLVRQTSSTHGKEGYITTDATEIGAQRQRMKDKLEKHVGEYSFFDFFRTEGSDTLVIAYGVTARAARQAIAEAKGKNASLLILKTLWPVPEELIARKAEGYSSIVVLEMNLGQYVHEIERVLKDKEVLFYGHMDGTLITPAQIREVIADV